MTGFTPKITKPIMALGLVLVLFSCAFGVSHYNRINQYLLVRDYDSALQQLQTEKKAYSKPNAALYYLEEGIISHFGGRFQKSNASLEKAEAVIDGLYARSVSKQTAALFINDLTIPYRGEDFENVLLNLFMALNYVGLNLWEDALVEARKVDSKLNVINLRYEDDQKNIYKEDAFIRFLMGVLYDAQGELNDAYVSYQKAATLYRDDYENEYHVSAPTILIQNLFASASAMGFHEEAADIREKHAAVAFVPEDQRRDAAEIYAIHYNGQGPEKKEERWFIPMPDGRVIKIAYPVFVRRLHLISRGEIFLSNQTSGETYRFSTELVEDIGAIAVKNLEDRTGRVRAKAIARATAKYLLTKIAARQVYKEGGELAGLLVELTGNILAMATENADLRHWRLLPSEIRLGRAFVAPGYYEGRAEFVDSQGNPVLTRAVAGFEVKAGQKLFLTFHTLQ